MWEWRCWDSKGDGTMEVLWLFWCCDIGDPSSVEVLAHLRSWNIGCPALLEVLSQWRWAWDSWDLVKMGVFPQYRSCNSKCLIQCSCSNTVGSAIVGLLEQWKWRSRINRGPLTGNALQQWTSFNIGGPATVDVMSQCHWTDGGGPATEELLCQ